MCKYSPPPSLPPRFETDQARSQEAEELELAAETSLSFECVPWDRGEGDTMPVPKMVRPATVLSMTPWTPSPPPPSWLRKRKMTPGMTQLARDRKTGILEI